MDNAEFFQNTLGMHPSASDKFMHDPRISIYNATTLDARLPAGWYAEVRISDQESRTYGPSRTRLGARRLAANYLARGPE